QLVPAEAVQQPGRLDRPALAYPRLDPHGARDRVHRRNEPGGDDAADGADGGEEHDEPGKTATGGNEPGNRIARGFGRRSRGAGAAQAGLDDRRGGETYRVRTARE